MSLKEFITETNPGLLKEMNNPEKIQEDPFDSDSKFMGTVHALDDTLYISSKGAAEAILYRSEEYLDNGKHKKITREIKEKWLKRNRQLSSKGLKVIACAYKEEEHSQKKEYQNNDDFVNGMIFLGLMSFVDPPKLDVSESIKKCHQAGVNVVMVTGDHAGTAKNIAEKVKLHSPEDLRIMEGKDIEENPDEIFKSNLFARVDPKQKYDIVEHFKEKGEITAMTGDGVNDAPALKKADIGIAMGKRGTQIAKDVADMVLKDDSFPSIVEAIEEGRIIFGNIRKFIIYQLSYHLAEILIIAGISFSLFYIPLLPLQLLFLNLLSDVFPALALGLGKGNPDVMNQKPKDPNEPIINKRNWITTGIYGVIMAVFISAAYLIVIYHFNESKEVANTVAFFTLALSQLLHVFNMREAKEKIFNNQITRNKYIWMALALCVLSLFAVYFITPLHDILSFTTLSAENWILIGITSFGTILFIQLIKQIFKL